MSSTPVVKLLLSLQDGAPSIGHLRGLPARFICVAGTRLCTWRPRRAWCGATPMRQRSWSQSAPSIWSAGSRMPT